MNRKTLASPSQAFMSWMFSSSFPGGGKRTTPALASGFEVEALKLSGESWLFDDFDTCVSCLGLLRLSDCRLGGRPCFRGEESELRVAMVIGSRKGAVGVGLVRMLLVATPGAPSSILAPSSKARSP